MQQLTLDQFSLQGDVAVLTTGPFMSQSRFVGDAIILLAELDLRLLDCSEGADKAQISFISGAETFILCYDATCEAVWIETLGSDQRESIKVLINRYKSR